MPVLAKITLLFVVFVDLIGQGLVFPIINSLVMQKSGQLLPADTSNSLRHLDYGLVIGSFFLAWFLGVVYISRLSDAIGRKNTLLICLGGALAGYVLTIAALYMESLWLMILGRIVTGFTAGNQPVAQAAMIDASTDDAERDRSMGQLLTGVSAGLVAGPILGGVLTDQALLGGRASITLPFYGALGLVLVAMAMVWLFFHDIRTERRAFDFRPAEIFESLWRITKHPKVMRLMPAFSSFMVANVTFYIFVDNYLTSAFGYGTIGGSVAMLVIGLAVALSGTFLVAPAQKRFDKRWIVGATLAVIILCTIAFIASPVAPLCYIPVFLFYLFFGVAYPTLLGIFSSSVGPEDQGWIMGVTVAVFTLAGGIMSLIGGDLMGIDIRLPFYIVTIAAILGLVLVATTWGSPEIRGLTKKPQT